MEEFQAGLENSLWGKLYMHTILHNTLGESENPKKYNRAPFNNFQPHETHSQTIRFCCFTQILQIPTK